MVKDGYRAGFLQLLPMKRWRLHFTPCFPRTEGIATISESTSFIRGVQDGCIFAKGNVIRKGRRVAFAEGEVFADGDEKTMLSRTSAAFAVTTNKP